MAAIGTCLFPGASSPLFRRDTPSSAGKLMYGGFPNMAPRLAMSIDRIPATSLTAEKEKCWEEEEELSPPHHFAYSDACFFLPNTTLYDYSFDPTCFLYPEINPPSYCEEPLISLNENFLLCPKRQKCSYDEQDFVQSSVQEVIPSNFFDGFVPNPCSLQTQEVPELSSSVQELKVPLLPQPQSTYVVGSAEPECEKKANESERIISAQSIAARERRRKIAEKTQELGKLVPGGPKMNTAEMLHAAAKYVKYLQAQVEMLQLMNTFEEDEAAPPPNEALHKLVVSPIVQEKLYCEERCFVPKEFVTTLTNLDDIRSRHTILEDLKQLIGTDIEKKLKKE